MASEISLTQAAVSPLRIQEGADRDFANKAPTSSQESSRIELKQTGKVDSTEEAEGLQGNTLKIEADASSFVEKKNEEETELTEKVSNLNDFVQNISRDLQFSVHKESGRTVVTVIDSETEEVIRKIPSDEVLKIAESLENLSGLLLKEQA